mmetsp:Transcript_27569/g.53799  ORF Transcript_27569/g.53799 Transcript_27569/m.53799 type:complete len:216 (-) Transcript_27569:2438-3085(-)
MPMSTPTVKHAHAVMHTKSIVPSADSTPISTTVFSQNTSESCACASDNAQRRRYEAVLEMHPSTYSIVWIIWCTISSSKLNSPCPWPPPWSAAGASFFSTGGGGGASSSASSSSSPSSPWAWWVMPLASSSAAFLARWAFLRRKGLGRSSRGTDQKAMKMRNICRPPCPGMTCEATGTEPISMNILMRVSRSEGGFCFQSAHPLPAMSARQAFLL